MSTLTTLPLNLDLPETHEIEPPCFWTQDDWVKLHQTSEPKLLYEISIKVIHRIHHHAAPVGVVIGPMMTGGLDPVKNFQIFEAAIQMIRMKGVAVFNQLVLLDSLVFYKSHNQFEVMSDLFLPLMRDGCFRRVFAIEGWESSTGASLEYKTFLECGISPELIPLEKISEYLA
jgi:hypothetical protein